MQDDAPVEAHTPNTGLASAFDFLGLPALVVDGFGRVLDANRAAHLTLTGELRLVDNRLSACGQRGVSGKLSRLLAGAASTSAMPPVVVPRSEQRPLIVYAFPCTPGAREVPSSAQAVVIVLDLGRKPAPRADDMRHAFGLTVAEANLVALLANGTGLHEAAGLLGVTKETVRSHLKAIFAKTGVQRQSELVALVARLPPACGAD